MTAVSSALASSFATADIKSNPTPLRLRHPDYTTPGSAPEGSESSGGEDSDEDGETTAVEGNGYADDNYVSLLLMLPSFFREAFRGHFGCWTGREIDDVPPQVRKVLAKERPLPPITLKTLHQEINVISTLALTVVPCLAFYGALTTEVRLPTVLWAIA